MKISSYVTLTRKTAFISIVLIMIVIIFDSTIVEFSAYVGLGSSTSINLITFTFLFLTFLILSTLLLISVKRLLISFESRMSSSSLYFFRMISAILISAAAIVLLIFFQILLFNHYSIVLLRLETYISHLSALLFLSLLVFLFVRWLISKMNYTILLYTVSFSLICASLLVSLMYLDTYLSRSPLPNVFPYPMVSYVTNLGGFPITESLSNTFDWLSLTSFLTMWLATATLLKQYRHRLGKVKYIVLLSLPLIYYIYPFENYFGDPVLSFLQSFSVTFSSLYILIYSATRQVGGFLFSIVFLTTSSLVYDDRIRKSLLISAIGMAILFGSIEITPLQYHVYPPFGFITEAFIPIGAYLLFVGIYVSARSIARDAEIRKVFYNSAERQLDLLRAIGVSEMEKELVKQVRSLEKNVSMSEIVDEPLEPDKVKLIIRDVLDELSKREK
jgi:hypothetical protein